MDRRGHIQPPAEPDDRPVERLDLQPAAALEVAQHRGLGAGIEALGGGQPGRHRVGVETNPFRHADGLGLLHHHAQQRPPLAAVSPLATIAPILLCL